MEYSWQAAVGSWQDWVLFWMKIWVRNTVGRQQWAVGRIGFGSDENTYPILFQEKKQIG